LLVVVCLSIDIQLFIYASWDGDDWPDRCRVLFHTSMYFAFNLHFISLCISLLSAVSAYDANMMTCLVNQARAQNGLKPMGMNTFLAQSAQGHSDYQSSINTMTHDGPGGNQPGDRITQAGFQWAAYGENVAQGQTTENEVMTDWMNSPGHRANILGDYDMMGSAQTGQYWTQDFATGQGGVNSVPVCDGSSDTTGSDQSPAQDPSSGQDQSMKPQDNQDQSEDPSSDEQSNQPKRGNNGHGKAHQGEKGPGSGRANHRHPRRHR